MSVYVITAVALLIYLIGAWFLGSILHLRGADLWILRGGLAFIGIVGSVAFLWFYLKISKQKSQGAVDSNKSGMPMGDIEGVIREAEARLKSSNLGRGANLRTLPVVLVFGPDGAAKTSIIVHSGLEAELLAGQVYQGKNVIPTRAASVWFARNTVFVDTGGKMTSDAGSWSRLLRLLEPGKMRSLRTGSQPRAAVVCVSCENFLPPASGDAAATVAEQIRTCLEQASKIFGTRVPVYVLFTKADRIPFFAEFAGRLSNDEATQVLGVTLPLRSVAADGVYAEQETQRLNAVFNNLILSLADKRVDLLSREHDSQKLGAIYEFPRELRKLRSPLVQFLVGIFRPSQLRATPILRGFYFSGVRAVIVNEIAKPVIIPQATPGAGFSPQTDATRMFQAGPSSARPVIPEPQVVGARKVPQWTFLAHFFNDLLLRDHLAQATASTSVKTATLRRVLLSAGTLISLLLALALTISYFGNRSLESEVLDAAQHATISGSSSSALPVAAALEQLERLRQSVEKLSGYQREGSPLHLHWGLYTGADLYSQSRSLYFSRFHQLIFGQTQAAILEFLKGVPSTPGPGANYELAYDLLKGYLITTSNHDKSTRMFLSPVLLKQWPENKNADSQTTALAQKQFDFYSEELKESNPFSSEFDTLAVERARQYLFQFAGAERVYQFMLAEASQKNPAVAFNRQFPGSAEVVVNTTEVSGAYTKAGWAFMQDAIKNADRFFSGEQWVLGAMNGPAVDRTKLEQELRDRYTADFIAQWQQFLRSASIVRYASIKDAAGKLSRLSSNQSPLLAMLCMLSQNTAVDSPQIKAAFQPAQFAVPATCSERYISEANTGYMNSLVALSSLFGQIAGNPGGANEPLTAQTLSAAVQAKIVTSQVAQNFRIDPQTHLESSVQKLMEDPITYAELLLRKAGPAELNAKGKALCAQVSDLVSKYPFNPGASRQATIAEVSAIFQPPQGALWSFYDANLRNHLVRQGPQYVANPSGSMSINPAFVNFWNRVTSFTDAVYPDNSAQPRLVYTLKPFRIEGIENVTLTIDGQSISTSAAGAASRQFVWSGNPTEIRLTGTFGRGSELAFSNYSGLWAPFQFFADADRWTTSGSVHTLEWVPRQGRGSRPMTLADGAPLTIRFDLDMGRAAPVFQKNFLSGLTCVAEIAR